MKKQSKKVWKQIFVMALIVAMLPVYSMTVFAAKNANDLVLDETLEQEMCEAFLTYLEEHDNIGYIEREYELADLKIEDYYGEYSGYHIAQMGFKDWAITSDMAYVYIAGYKFVFGSSCFPPYFLAYKDGEMLLVKDAYKQGLLSDDDVRRIAVAFGAIDLWECPFADVAKEDWYYEYIKYAYSNNLFLGLTENTFGPDEEMTRAMLTTVLWRYAGSPVGYENAFDDVLDGVWYTEAVSWAAANEIVYGMSENTFAPDETVTREQITAILHRYAKLLTGEELKPEFELKGFDDLNEISDWAYESMNWAEEHGLIYGRGINNTFCLAPVATATRAEVAAFLMRFVEYID